MERPLQAVILAAGKGKRLEPVTLRMSKAMAPVLGKPIVGRIVERFMDVLGIGDFVLVVNDRDSDICRYFDEEFPRTAQGRHARVTYAIQEQRLGMAHALQQARPLIHGAFVLSACDNLHTEQHIAALQEAHTHRQRPGTLTLMPLPPEQVTKSGIVELQGHDVVRIVEKPSLAEAPSNIGSVPLYLFEPRILDYLDAVRPSPRGEYELQDAMQALIADCGPMHGVFASRRFDLTSTQDLLNINLHYFDAHYDEDAPHYGPVAKHCMVHGRVRIEEAVELAVPCHIGPRAYLGRGCRIGEGCRIEHTMVLPGTIIPPGQHLSYEVAA